jgi:hypothetical protein
MIGGVMRVRHWLGAREGTHVVVSLMALGLIACGGDDGGSDDAVSDDEIIEALELKAEKPLVGDDIVDYSVGGEDITCSVVAGETDDEGFLNDAEEIEDAQADPLSPGDVYTNSEETVGVLANALQPSCERTLEERLNTLP